VARFQNVGIPPSGRAFFIPNPAKVVGLGRYRKKFVSLGDRGEYVSQTPVWGI